MDSIIGFEMSFFVVEAIRGRCASFIILTATVGDMWWTDKCTCFSSIDVIRMKYLKFRNQFIKLQIGHQLIV